MKCGGDNIKLFKVVLRILLQTIVSNHELVHYQYRKFSKFIHRSFSGKKLVSQNCNLRVHPSILFLATLSLHYLALLYHNSVEEHRVFTLPHTKSKHAGFNYELFKIHSEICIIPILFFSYCELYHIFCKLYDCIVHIIKKFTIKLLYCNNNTVQN